MPAIKRKIAPLVVFAYNRPQHLRETLDSLACNSLAKATDLYVFSDGPKGCADYESVRNVRQLLYEYQNESVFRSFAIEEASSNKGLADSIIQGVEKIIKCYGKVIVVEDDVITSSDFLDYMNTCLDYYETKHEIWSIGGYSFPINFPPDYKHDVFLMGRGSSYAWGTWIDRWEKVDWEVSDYDRFRFNRRERAAFNLFGNDRSLMLDAWKTGNNSSWAIRFSYAMFKNNMYAVLPRDSRVKNTGMDGSGTHALTVSHEFDTEIPEKTVGFTPSLPALDKRIVKQYRAKFNQKKSRRIIKWFLYTLAGVNLHRTGVYRLYKRRRYGR